MKAPGSLSAETEALVEAVCILHFAAREVSCGPMPILRFLIHAEQHVAELLKERLFSELK